MSQRVVGILGGMGPEATILLQQRVLATVQACDDADHLPLLIKTDKPLGSGPKNQRRAVAPAMGVALVIGIPIQQTSLLGQHLENRVCRLINMLTFEQRCAGQIDAVAAHRVIDLQFVGDPRCKVIFTVAGGDMHRTGTGIQGDEISGDDAYPAPGKGMI